MEVNIKWWWIRRRTSTLNVKIFSADNWFWYVLFSYCLQYKLDLAQKKIIVEHDLLQIMLVILLSKQFNYFPKKYVTVMLEWVISSTILWYADDQWYVWSTICTPHTYQLLPLWQNLKKTNMYNIYIHHQLQVRIITKFYSINFLDIF